MIDVIAIVEVHRLFHRSSVDAREPAQNLRKRAIALGIVDGPARAALAPVAAAEETEAGGGVHQSPDHELAGDLVVGRQIVRRVVAFEAVDTRNSR